MSFPFSTTLSTRVRSPLTEEEAPRVGPTPPAFLEPHAAPTPTRPGTILVLTANAVHRRARLQLEEEARTIEDAVKSSHHRERYTLRLCLASTFARMIRALDDHRPTLTHFSGHGATSGSLILQDEDGGEHRLPPSRFAEMLATLRFRPTLITFATCYSCEVAKAAARYAHYAIGFDGPLEDTTTAPRFSAMLYERLASYETLDVPRAFALARLACVASECKDAEQARLFEHPGREMTAA